MVVAQIWLQHSTSLDTVLQENSYLFIQWKKHVYKIRDNIKTKSRDLHAATIYVQ